MRTQRIHGLLAVVISMLFSLPLMFSPYVGDEVWAIYTYGSDYLRNPLSLLTRPLNEIPIWLDHGNFRPVGRLFEHLGYALTMLLTTMTRVEPYFWYALIRFVSTTVFFLLIFVFVKAVVTRANQDGARLALIAVVSAGSIGLVNNSYAGLRLFPTFYTSALIFVLLSLYWYLNFYFRVTLRIVRVSIQIVIGAVSASFSELTYLTLPLLFFLCFLTVSSELQRTLKARIVASLKIIWPTLITFLLIWIPVRLIIFINCRSTDCYEPSSIAINLNVFQTWSQRFFSSIPPYPQIKTLAIVKPIEVDLPFLLIFLIIGVVSFFIVNWFFGKRQKNYVKSTLNTTLVAFGLIITILASILASLSSSLQGIDTSGTSWRETPFYIIGLAFVITGTVNLLKHPIFQGSFIRGIVSLVVSSVFALLAVVTSILNAELTDLYSDALYAKNVIRIEEILTKTNPMSSELTSICSLIKNEVTYGEFVSNALLDGTQKFARTMGHELTC